jgi:polyisoprenoid-binding protein YceI
MDTRQTTDQTADQTAEQTADQTAEQNVGRIVRRIIGLTASVILASSLALAAQSFRITGTQNLATVQSDTTVEKFVGRTSKVTGEISFDPTSKTGGGTITVDGASIETGNTGRDESMRSTKWLNFDKFPQVRFEALKVSNTSGDQYTVVGKLSMSGKTRDVNANATLRFLPASEQTKKLGFQGDVINLRATLTIKLSEFGVVIPEMSKASVADAQRIQINVFASNK